MATINVIEIARNYNNVTANLKNWKLTKAGKRAREIARMALTSDILIGTAQEIADRFPELWGSAPIQVADHDENDRFAWAVMCTPSATGKQYPSLGCVGKID